MTDALKYRKLPVVIEAMQFTDENKNQVFNWITCNHYADFEEPGAYNRPTLKIETLEGDMVAKLGDYIIKGVNGEFYPCKRDIFEKTYEPVEVTHDCKNCKNYIPYEEEDDDEPFLDDDEYQDRENERLAECTCGAWQWSQKRGEFVHVADCVCGKV